MEHWVESYFDSDNTDFGYNTIVAIIMVIDYNNLNFN